VKATVKVEGLRELEKALLQFDPRKRRAIGRKALDEGGQLLARAARDKAPVLEGHLRESIDVSGTLTKDQRAAYPKTHDQERYVGPTSNYSQAQLREFGGDGAPPHPFMRPALDETGDKVIQRIGDELWLGIAKALKAAARRAARLAKK